MLRRENNNTLRERKSQIFRYRIYLDTEHDDNSYLESRRQLRTGGENYGTCVEDDYSVQSSVARKLKKRHYGRSKKEIGFSLPTQSIQMIRMRQF